MRLLFNFKQSNPNWVDEDQTGHSAAHYCLSAMFEAKEDCPMAEAATKLPVKTETPTAPASRLPEWRPFDSLRNQVDRLFRDFETGFLQTPFSRQVENFWRRDFAFPVTPAVDIIEKDNAFEITAELPGLDAKNIELSLSDDVLT
ncbi:MAG: Hsp20/alpha crystallin family protein, partial [Bradyrhizobium sp.]|nr:Hsp20/alpha crystallin family protein [Bradyrhizobium sp.]